MQPKVAVAFFGLLLAASAARSEILEWTDAAGARHFTNRRDLVPADRRGDLRVIVAAGEPAVENASVTSAPTAPPAAPPPAAPLVVGDRPGWRDAYEAGFSDGRAAGTDEDRGGPGPQVNIVGPLAVASVEGDRPANVFNGAWSPYYPFVTTSFDRGRSRHLTLRMLLQDQFQLDRDGPFVYERLNAPGVGPNLQPFLPRGLPRHYSRGPRVLFR